MVQHAPVKLTYIDNLFYVQTSMGLCIPFNLFGCTKVTLTDVIEPSKIVKPLVAPVAKSETCPVVAPVVEDMVAPVVAPVVPSVVAPVVAPVVPSVVAPVVEAVVAPEDCSEVLPVPSNTIAVVPVQMTMSDDSSESNHCWDKESFAILIGVGLLGLMLSPVLVVMFPVIRGVDSIMDNLVQDDDVKYKVE